MSIRFLATQFAIHMLFIFPGFLLLLWKADFWLALGVLLIAVGASLRFEGDWS